MDHRRERRGWRKRGAGVCEMSEGCDEGGVRVYEEFSEERRPMSRSSGRAPREEVHMKIETPPSLPPPHPTTLGFTNPFALDRLAVLQLGTGTSATMDTAHSEIPLGAVCVVGENTLRTVVAWTKQESHRCDTVTNGINVESSTSRSQNEGDRVPEMAVLFNLSWISVESYTAWLDMSLTYKSRPE
ncbi:hypothetical protein B0H12DRAFT_1074339 [Mycena haematopus]|nr:hypothetical protein B0H12DRAFT_1077405 [Mycena haematopus]KAJ7242150.1 hypothetical protein B0H12DRAFT_1074339 [Mycena haematopus]